MRAAISFGLVLGVASVASAHEGDKPRASDERAGNTPTSKNENDPKSEKPLSASELQVLNATRARP